MKTIWLTKDRQGEKYFSKKPYYNEMHGIYMGDRCLLPKRRESYRLIKKFKVKIEEAPWSKWLSSTKTLKRIRS